MKTEFQKAPNISVTNDKANPFEVCRSLEMCRRAIIDINATTTFRFNPASSIASLEEAIVELAIAIGDDNPYKIHSILDEIGYTGRRGFDEEF